MESLETGELFIQVTATPTVVRLEWRGQSNARRPGETLRPFFGQALDQAAAANASIEMHFETLEYFNSSTIAELIKMIREARTRDIKLLLLYDAESGMQRASFDALRIFDRNDGMLELRPA